MILQPAGLKNTKTNASTNANMLKIPLDMQASIKILQTVFFCNFLFLKTCFLFVFCAAQAPIKIIQTGGRAEKSRTVASLASAAISECT